MSGPIAGDYPDGSSGHSGSDTSKERAEREDASGVTGWRQQRILQTLELRGGRGRTVGEVEQGMKMGHGAASGALSRLHRAGHVVRLKERRNGQEVYIHPKFHDGQEESPYRPNVVHRNPPMALELTDQMIRDMMTASGLMPPEDLTRIRNFIDRVAP